MINSINLPREICNELKTLVKAILNQYAENVQKIILFGSFATNQYQPESDFDICLILNEKQNINLIKKKMEELVDKCNFARGVDLILCSHEELINGNMIYKYIRRDGVILYEQI